MFKFVAVFAACLAYASAGLVQPTAFAAAPAGLAYANAPLYAAGGSQQVDVRQNYDGTFSSYTTNPFGFAAPYSTRYVAGAPVAGAAFAAPAKYVAPAGVATPFAAAAPAAYAAPAKFVAPAGVAASPYAVPYANNFAAAAAAYNTYANTYAASPVSAPVA